MSLVSVFVLFLVVTLAGPASAIQTSECFPKDASPNAPIGAIYLHGLFPPSGARDSSGYVGLETANRKYLEKLAKTLGIRIAVPTSPTIATGSYGTNRNWNGKTLKQVEALARAACGGAPLAKSRALVGFSNGGYAVRSFANLKCEQLTDYSVIVSIGAGNGAARNCKPTTKFVNKAPHVFPPKGDPSLADYLADAPRISMKPDGQAPAAADNNSMFFSPVPLWRPQNGTR